MSALPPLPQTLVVHPSPGAQADAVIGHTDLMGHTTFKHLIEALGQMPDWRFVRGAVPALVVRQLLQRADADTPQGLWAAAAADAWGVRAVTQAILEVRRAGLSARALMAAAEPSPALMCLRALLGDYEEALESEHWYDEADRERQAVLTAVQGGLPAHLASVTRVEVACGTDILGARLDMLSALAARGLEVLVTLPFDAARPHVFAWPEAMLHALESRGHQRIEVQFDARTGHGPLQALRAAQYTGEVVSTAPVQVVEVPADTDHMTHCVLQVAQLIEAGVPRHAIACVLPDYAGESTGVSGWALCDALHDAHIVAAAGRGPALGQTPWAQGLLLLVNLAQTSQRGFARADLTAAWRLWGHDDESLGALGTKTHIGDWLARLTVARLRPGQVREALVAAALGPHAKAAREAATHVASVIEAFMARIAAWPAQADLRTHLQTAAQWLSHVPKSPQSFTKELLLALNALADACEQAQTLNGWSRDELGSWLAAAFDEMPLPRPAAAPGAVLILTPDDMVGRRMQAVVLVGANTGVFPRVAHPDPVLTDTLRGEINAIVGPRLMQYAPLSGRGALPADAKDTWLWVEVMHAASARLILTVAATPGEEDTGQSDIVDALRRSCPDVMVPLSPSYVVAQQATASGYLRHAAWLAQRQAGPEALALGQLGLASLPQGLPDAIVQRWTSIRRRQQIGLLCEVGRPPALNADVQAQWRAHLGHHMHSASRLDALGTCRYRHFAAAGLGMQTPEVAQLHGGPAIRGRVAHAALQAVYTAFSAQGGLAAARANPPAAWRIAREAFAAADAAMRAEAQLHALLTPAMLREAWDAVVVQLGRDLREGQSEPLALEYGFGSGKPGAVEALALLVPEAQLTLRVRGSIDRVDATRDTLLTLDYKSTVRKRESGRHFQLGVYAAVALRDLKANAQMLRTTWLGLFKDETREGTEDGNPTTPKAFLEGFQRDVAKRLVPSLAGDIAPDPDDGKSCTYCDYLSLCRYRKPLEMAEASSDGDSETSL